MRNVKVFNAEAQPLFIFEPGNLIHQGRLFVCTSGVLLAGTGQNCSLLLTNPIGSGVHLHIDQIIAAADAGAWLTLFFDVTAAAGLTARSVMNMNRGLPDTLNKGTVAAGGGAGVALTGGTAALTWRLEPNGAALVPLEGGAFIAEGKNLGLQATFELGGRCAFNLVWWEEPLGEL